MNDHIHIKFFLNSQCVFKLIDPDPEEFDDLFYRLIDSELCDFEVHVKFCKGVK